MHTSAMIPLKFWILATTSVTSGTELGDVDLQAAAAVGISLTRSSTFILSTQGSTENGSSA